MFTIDARNVAYGYAQAVRLIRAEGVRQPSRGGEVLVLPGPLVTTIHKPAERVLLNPSRDCNPFLHLFEALFHLAGRDDYTWLDRFRRNFSVNYGEKNGVGHGSYGARWRSHFGFDQLDVVVEKLQTNPTDRRVVVSMWDTSNHVEEVTQWSGGPARNGADDLRAEAQDIPCNTHIYPRIREGVLDLTVCCRSNDLIWGLFGANIAQFSMLQEYLAGRIGVGVGRLYTLSNNAHAYTHILDRQPQDPLPGPHDADEYMRGEVSSSPLMYDPGSFDEDLQWFFKIMLGEGLPTEGSYTYHNPWFMDVVFPMYAAHHHFKLGDKKHALSLAGQITASDWRAAAQGWIQRRMK